MKKEFNDSKEFLAGTINITEKELTDPITGKKIPPQKIVQNDRELIYVKDMETFLITHKEEINLWFEILKDNYSNYKKSIIIRRAIGLELFIFCTKCLELASRINKSIRKLKSLHTENNRTFELPPIDVSSLKKTKAQLKDFRRRIGAHRYTDENGNYISIAEVMRLYKKIDENKLYSARDFYLKILNKFKIGYLNIEII